MILFKTCTNFFSFFLHLVIIDFIEADKMIYFIPGSQEVKDWDIPMVQARARAIGKELKYGFFKFPLSDQFRQELVDENNALYQTEERVGYEARNWIYGNGTILPRRFAKVFSSNYTAFDWTHADTLP